MAERVLRAVVLQVPLVVALAVQMVSVQAVPRLAPDQDQAEAVRPPR